MNPPIALLALVWLIGLLGLAVIIYGVRALFQDWRGLGDDERLNTEERKNERIRREIEQWREGK